MQQSQLHSSIFAAANSNNKPVKKMASSSHRRGGDYGEEFVERLRKDRFKKAYIVVNGVSSGDEEEEDEELDFEEEEDEEMASYAVGPAPRMAQSQHPPRPGSTHSYRKPQSVAASYTQRRTAYGFDARDLYFFGVLSELTDKFTPERAARLIARSPPPPDYRTLVSIERIAYLLYYSLYGRYLDVPKFHNVFNREFYKYTSAGDNERKAFVKICRHTLAEYKRRTLEMNKRAYKMTQKHLFSDERDTPDSRLSDRPSVCADGSEDQNSLDSLAKELMFFRAPHTPVRFAPGGRLIYVNPNASMNAVCIDDTKKFYRDAEGRRYVEMFNCFKGPMLVGHTPPQTPLLFVQRQIDRIMRSDVYQADPASRDANDCLLIWHLLEMLIRQQGKVTGPDLARLLCSNQHYTAFSARNFLRSSNSSSHGTPETVRQHSVDSSSNELVDSAEATDRMTRLLLGGHIEEAIDSAIGDGLLFDALLLAHRLFANDRRRLDMIEAKLMAHRSAQHPITTLVSVAADLPVPLLNNPTTDDANGWRAHIAIVLANLQTQTAMNAVYQLGLALAQKEFNAAADFCFLAVNLLTGYNCFQAPAAADLDEQTAHRRHVHLVSASLPDDELNSSLTRFGWSILDYQATEIYDFALQMSCPGSATLLSASADYQRTRQQYVQLLGELGGFGYAIELYNSGNMIASEVPRHGYEQQAQGSGPTTTNTSFFQANLVQFESPKRSVQPQAQAEQPKDSHAHFGQQMAIGHQQQQKQPYQQQEWPNSNVASHQAAEQPKQSHHPLPQQQKQQHPPNSNFSQLQQQPNEQHWAPTITMPPAPAQWQQQQQQMRQNSRERNASRFSGSSEGSGGDEEDEELEGEEEEEQQPQQQPNADFPYVHVPPVAFPMPPFLNQSNFGKEPPNEQQVEVVNVQQRDARRTSISSSIASHQSQQQPMVAINHNPTNPPLPKDNSNLMVKQQQRTTTTTTQQLTTTSLKEQPRKPTENAGSTTGGGGGGRFLSSLLSKIKPLGPKEMKLPDDKSPKIKWDEQQGRYVDQEQKDQPVEELAPPPMTFYRQTAATEQQQNTQQQQQQAYEARTSTPIPVLLQEGQQQQQPLTFPMIPADISAIPQPNTTSNKNDGAASPRPFQGRARYANAWNS